MKCPGCGEAALTERSLEEGVKVRFCSTCEGMWLSSTDYWAWLDHHGETLPEKPYSEIAWEVADSDKAKLCLDCGRILIKYRVGHGLDFRLDHCNHCNGVWFDAHEWDALKSRNLHDEIHAIFTTPWQQQLRHEERHAFYEKIYREKFGGDYERLREFKVWLDAHSLKNPILAFLEDPDPFEG